MQGASVSYVDENLDLARADPSMMLIGDRPHVIDEWQRVPAIWDCVRHEVDRARGTRGAFILTGSSTPATRKGEQGPAHSGAGRIGRVRMSPMRACSSPGSQPDRSVSRVCSLVNSRRVLPSATRWGLSKLPVEAAGRRLSTWKSMRRSLLPASTLRRHLA